MDVPLYTLYICTYVYIYIYMCTNIYIYIYIMCILYIYMCVASNSIIHHIHHPRFHWPRLLDRDLRRKPRHLSPPGVWGGADV